MRRLILGTAALLASVVAVAVQGPVAQERRAPPAAQQDDGSWLDPGPAPSRDGPEYMDESDDQPPVDGGVTGGDSFDQEAPPEDGPEEFD